MFPLPPWSGVRSQGWMMVQRTNDARMTPRQAEVLGFLSLHPGATIQLVADGLGMSHTAAGYLLRVLQRSGHIEAARHGRTVRHYRMDSASSRQDRLAPILRDSNRARVLDDIRASSPGGTSINRLAQRLGLGFSLVKSTLEELDGLGLVRLEHTHGRYRVHRIPGSVLAGSLLEVEAAGGPKARPLEPSVPLLGET